MTKDNKFEKNMEEMDKMSPEQMATKLKDLDQECLCGMCPTYLGTEEEKLTFCIIGKSNKIEEDKGCICPGCPVQIELHLKWQYYCTKGSGKELAKIQ